MQALYNTYNKNINFVGREERRDNSTFSLSPISHATKKADIEVLVTEEGEFHSARRLDKKEEIFVPGSEGAIGRTSGINPLALHDEIAYVCGGLRIKDKNDSWKINEKFIAYIDQLSNWENSEYTNYKIQAIYKYISKETVISDLLADNVFSNEECDLISLDEESNLYFINNAILKMFIRFDVYSPKKILTPVWKDSKVQQLYINYYQTLTDESNLCYVTGGKERITTNHQREIIKTSAKAKLISSQNANKLPFAGRFSNGDEAVLIGYESSQKAHNALKWLIKRQGRNYFGREFLIWSDNDDEIITPYEDTHNLFYENINNIEDQVIETAQWVANEVHKAIMGYKAKLDFKEEVNILVLDAATDGRLSIHYFNNMQKDLYLDRIEQWHTKCIWKHTYKKSKEDKRIIFIGAPALMDIARAAYGKEINKSNEWFYKDTIERVLPCIISNRKQFPIDIKRKLVQRASNPVSMEKWEWRKTLSIACAVINYEEESYSMAINESTKNRSYLFGRLLGLANTIEERAFYQKGIKNEDKRDTTADKYMAVFSNKPARTWNIIYKQIILYKNKVSYKLFENINEIIDKFEFEDFNDTPLEPVYLLGYSNQIEALKIKKNKDNELSEENE